MEKLPKTARRIKPIIKKVGDWVEMTFDAILERNGLTWLRVKDGFGEKGNREDWVLDIPTRCVSISDYKWKGKNLGRSYKSFEHAIDSEVLMALDFLKERKEKLRDELDLTTSAIGMLYEAIYYYEKRKKAKKRNKVTTK